VILPLAHITPVGSLGFIVPLIVLAVWLKFQGRRNARRIEAARAPAEPQVDFPTFTEDWTLSKRDGRWRIVAVDPVDTDVRSPWSDSIETTEEQGEVRSHDG
jgi:hypothetical protein